MRMRRITTMMMMKTKTTISLLCTGLLLLSSVNSGAAERSRLSKRSWLDLVNDYTSADKVQYEPDRWEQLTAKYTGGHHTNILAEWWSTFNDETLTKLIDMAFEHNPDLNAARSRVLQARAQLGVTMAGKSPRVDGRVYMTDADTSKNNPMAGGGASYHTYDAAFSASWELDFFGKKQDLINAGKSALEAEYANLHHAWVLLSAETASEYITLRTLQKQIEAAEKNIAAQSEMLEIVESMFKAGLRDELAVQQTRYSLESMKAAVPQLRQSAEAVMNSLAVLTGEVPGSLTELLGKNGELPDVDVMMMAGIPAETIRQRPDIAAAEKNFEAQVSRRKSAQKEYYPTISLTGSIGLESLSTGTLLKGSCYFFNLVPSVNIPIFRAGEIRKNIRVQNELEEQALSALEKTILNAAAEVRNALEANVQEAARNEHLKEGLAAAQMALETARNKYFNGLSDFSSVLSAMQSVYSLENSLAASRGQMMNNLIALFKALGGGWGKEL